MHMNIEHMSEESLQAELKAAHEAVEVGATYKHYRGIHYQVTGIAIIEATQEVSILYQKLEGSDRLQSITWVRPLSSWLEEVCVEGQMVPRFQKS